MSIPLRVTENGHMVTTVSINGAEPVEAIIDTAANIAMVDEGSLTAAGLAPPENPEPVTVIGVWGASPYPKVRLQNVVLSVLALGDMDAALNDLSFFRRTTNVVPATAFGHRTLDFDFPSRRLRAHDGAPRRRLRQEASAVPIEPLQGMWLAPVEINGRRGLALIDTGSNATFINRAFATHAGARQSGPEKVMIAGSTEPTDRARLAKVRRLQLGRYHVRGVEIAIADTPLFDHLGIGDQPVMVLGIDFLQHFRVQIDRERERLYISQY
ncbi:MAG: aspartyl protease family protein [Pseudomonadota bacterium]